MVVAKGSDLAVVTEADTNSKFPTRCKSAIAPKKAAAGRT